MYEQAALISQRAQGIDRRDIKCWRCSEPALPGARYFYWDSDSHVAWDANDFECAKCYLKTYLARMCANSLGYTCRTCSRTSSELWVPHKEGGVNCVSCSEKLIFQAFQAQAAKHNLGCAGKCGSDPAHATTIWMRDRKKIWRCPPCSLRHRSDLVLEALSTNDATACQTCGVDSCSEEGTTMLWHHFHGKLTCGTCKNRWGRQNRAITCPLCGKRGEVEWPINKDTSKGLPKGKVCIHRIGTP
jgi:DNA-directed RNA polymerase subunit RPC12/RpoP